MNNDVNQILENPWNNIYWFARMLINSDKYGGIGSDSRTMQQLASCIKVLLPQVEKENDVDAFNVLMEAIRNLLFERYGKTKKQWAIKQLCDDLADKLLTLKDFEILAITCEKILVPVNEALSRIPNDDKSFAQAAVKAILDVKKENGLATIINIWDNIGVQGCLAAERSEVIDNFKNLREYLETLKLSVQESDMVLTAFCQEFERRLGQKRKGRAGRSLESVTSFILDYFSIKAAHAPEHFTTGLEIDKWVRCKDGWLIGISCKRTLRERWKQAYTTDIDLLNRHKIKALWHLITYDRDLSDDKITEMGSHRAVLYLPDDSERYLSAKNHPGMKDYVRPLSQVINDLKQVT